MNFALIVFIIIGFCAYLASRQPDAGLTWSFISGKISFVSPLYQSLFEPGDKIIAINGLSLAEARYLPGKQAGDTVEILVLSREKTIPITVTLQRPGLDVLINRFLVLLIAILFSLISLLVLFYSRLTLAIISFFLFCQGFSLTLATGSVSAYAPLWMVWLFNSSTWWVVPIGVLFQSLFLFSPLSTQARKALRFLFYLTVLGFGLYSINFLYGQFAWIRSVQYPWIMLNFCLMIGLVFLKVKKEPAGNTKKILTPVLLGVTIGILPFLLLTLLPEMLFGKAAISGSGSLLAMISIPAGYGYAFLQNQFVHLERYVQRAAIYGIIITFFSFLYFTGLQISHIFIPVDLQFLTNFIFIVLMVITYNPLYQLLQTTLTRLLFSQFWDEDQAIQYMQTALATKADTRENLPFILSETIQNVFTLEKTTLLLADGNYFITQHNQSFQEGNIDKETAQSILDHLQRHTKEKFGVNNQPFVSLQPGKELKEAFLKLSAWVLIDSLTTPTGILLLGPRHGGDFYEKTDWELLEKLIRQTKFAMENALLNQELRKNATQIRLLNRKLFLAKEDEKNVSRPIFTIR
jgi:hypothetical protein